MKGKAKRKEQQSERKTNDMTWMKNKGKEKKMEGTMKKMKIKMKKIKRTET